MCGSGYSTRLVHLGGGRRITERARGSKCCAWRGRREVTGPGQWTGRLDKNLLAEGSGVRRAGERSRDRTVRLEGRIKVAVLGWCVCRGIAEPGR